MSSSYSVKIVLDHFLGWIKLFCLVMGWLSFAAGSAPFLVPSRWRLAGLTPYTLVQLRTGTNTQELASFCHACVVRNGFQKSTRTAHTTCRCGRSKVGPGVKW